MDQEALKATMMEHVKARTEATKEFMAALNKNDHAGKAAANEKAKAASEALKAMVKSVKK